MKSLPMSRSGASNGNAKLDETSVARIRAAYGRKGTSYRTIAADFGVAKSTVMKIIRRETWRNDPTPVQRDEAPPLAQTPTHQEPTDTDPPYEEHSESKEPSLVHPE